LSQQLVAGGEEVVDVPAVLAARVRVLGAGGSQKKTIRTIPARWRSRVAGRSFDGGARR